MQRNVVNGGYFISDFDFDLDYILYMIQGSGKRYVVKLFDAKRCIPTPLCFMISE